LTEIVEVPLLETTLKEYIRPRDVTEMGQRLASLPKHEKHNPRLIVNLARTKALNWDAIGHLLFLSKRFEEAEGKVIFCGLSPMLMQSFTQLRLDVHLKITTDVDAALEALGITKPPLCGAAGLEN
jgi:anti-anti-sigma regulatory factor